MLISVGSTSRHHHQYNVFSGCLGSRSSFAGSANIVDIIDRYLHGAQRGPHVPFLLPCRAVNLFARDTCCDPASNLYQLPHLTDFQALTRCGFGSHDVQTTNLRRLHETWNRAAPVAGPVICRTITTNDHRSRLEAPAFIATHGGIKVEYSLFPTQSSY